MINSVNTYIKGTVYVIRALPSFEISPFNEKQVYIMLQQNLN